MTMDISAVKAFVENPTKVTRIPFMIWVDPEGFLSYQYIRQLVQHMQICFCDVPNQQNIGIQVIHTDIFDLASDIQLQDGIIFICKSISNELASTKFNNILVKFPVIEKWQIQDFVQSTLPNVSIQQINKLIAACNNSMFRIDLELDKLKVINTSEQNEFIDRLIFEDNMPDLFGQTMISKFCSAILDKDADNILKYYQPVKNSCTSQLAVYNTIYCNVRKLFLILTNNCRESISGITSMQEVQLATKYSKIYSSDDLKLLLLRLSELDYMLALKTITEDMILQYILHIFL